MLPLHLHNNNNNQFSFSVRSCGIHGCSRVTLDTIEKSGLHCHSYSLRNLIGTFDQRMADDDDHHHDYKSSDPEKRMNGV